MSVQDEYQQAIGFHGPRCPEVAGPGHSHDSGDPPLVIASHAGPHGHGLDRGLHDRRTPAALRRPPLFATAASGGYGWILFIALPGALLPALLIRLRGVRQRALSLEEIAP